MKLKYLRLIIIFLAGVLSVKAQINPGPDLVFNPNVLASIEITMDTADKAFLLAEENKWSEDYLPVSVRFINDKLDTILTGSGIRLRGNTSRSHPKKSFKIDLKEFGGSKFYGQKKFNLKAENNDPTFLREHLSLETYRKANIPAARSHFAKVYINGEYMGVYLNVEQIDDEFVDTRFGNDKGNLYKCGWGSSLESNSKIFDDGVFELETNKTANDRIKLKHFIEALNNTSDDSFSVVIQRYINVKQVTRSFATEILLGHWDGYIYNQNNFYLYENPDNGLMEFIPYDLDNTFGMDWVGGNWGTRDVLDWSQKGQERPLFDRLMKVPAFKNQFQEDLQFLVDNVFNTSKLFPEFDALKLMLEDAVKEDIYYTKTFGFKFSDFEDGHIAKVVKHAPYGLRPFVETRVKTAGSQVPLGIDNYAVQLTTIQLFPNPIVGASFKVAGMCSDEVKVTTLDGRDVALSINKLNYNTVEITLLNEVASGIYILQAGTIRKRFVIQ